MATIGAMRAIRALDLNVPRDISIVGIDDFEWADCFEPRLTVVAQPCEEIGRQAAALLSERIAASDGPRRTIRLDGKLIQRDSAGRRHDQRRKGSFPWRAGSCDARGDQEFWRRPSAPQQAREAICALRPP